MGKKKKWKTCKEEASHDKLNQTVELRSDVTERNAGSSTENCPKLIIL